jgi:hypothetical protein
MPAALPDQNPEGRNAVMLIKKPAELSQCGQNNSWEDSQKSDQYYFLISSGPLC